MVVAEGGGGGGGGGRSLSREMEEGRVSEEREGKKREMEEGDRESELGEMEGVGERWE